MREVLSGRGSLRRSRRRRETGGGLASLPLLFLDRGSRRGRGSFRRRRDGRRRRRRNGSARRDRLDHRDPSGGNGLRAAGRGRRRAGGEAPARHGRGRMDAGRGAGAGVRPLRPLRRAVRRRRVLRERGRGAAGETKGGDERRLTQGHLRWPRIARSWAPPRCYVRFPTPDSRFPTPPCA